MKEANRQPAMSHAKERKRWIDFGLFSSLNTYKCIIMSIEQFYKNSLSTILFYDATTHIKTTFNVTATTMCSFDCVSLVLVMPFRLYTHFSVYVQLFCLCLAAFCLCCTWCPHSPNTHKRKNQFEFCTQCEAAMSLGLLRCALNGMHFFCCVCVYI